MTRDRRAYHRDYYLRYKQRHVVKDGPRVEAATVLAHVEQLRAAGMTNPQIATAAGVDRHTVAELGQRPLVNATTARAVLAVTADAHRPYLVDITGSTRRARSLIAAGYSRRDLARLTSASQHTIIKIVAGQGTVARPSADRLAAVWMELRDVPGTCRAARTEGARRSWHVPDAWDPDTIDDPTATTLLRTERNARRLAALVEDLQDLAATGETLDSAIRRVGSTRDAVERCLARARRFDVLEQLRRNDPAWVDPARRITQDEARRITSNVHAGTDHGPAAGLTLSTRKATA